MPRLNDWSPDAITTAVTATTGVGATEFFRADAPTWVKKIIFTPAGTNAGATVARIFLNNGDDSSVARNNVLVAEHTLPAMTASQTAAQTAQALTLDLRLADRQRLLCALGAGASPGWYVSAHTANEPQPTAT